MPSLEEIPEDTLFARSDTLRKAVDYERDTAFQKRPRRKPRRNFFSQRVVIPWNVGLLPQKVVCGKTRLQFKIEYYKWGGGVNKLSYPDRPHTVCEATQVNSGKPVVE